MGFRIQGLKRVPMARDTGAYTGALQCLGLDIGDTLNPKPLTPTWRLMGLSNYL